MARFGGYEYCPPMPIMLLIYSSSIAYVPSHYNSESNYLERTFLSNAKTISKATKIASILVISRSAINSTLLSHSPCYALSRLWRHFSFPRKSGRGAKQPVIVTSLSRIKMFGGENKAEARVSPWSIERKFACWPSQFV